MLLLFMLCCVPCLYLTFYSDWVCTSRRTELILASYFELNAELIENTQSTNNGWYVKQDVSHPLSDT